MADLAIVIVSTNEAHWIEQCLPTVFDHAGDARLEVIVVDNSSTDGTRELVESSFPRPAWCVPPTTASDMATTAESTGQRALRAVLNPDTEVLDGTFGELVRLLDERPEVGLAGVRQFGPDGTLGPTIRRFPSVDPHARRGAVLRALAGSSAWRESACSTRRATSGRKSDWVSGSFMLVRREALLTPGCWTSASSSTRGAGPVPADQARGCRFAICRGWRSSTTRARRGAPADDRAGRLHAQAVRTQALRRLLSRPLPRGVQSLRTT